jgi:PAS domain S-box-containing protein
MEEKSKATLLAEIQTLRQKIAEFEKEDPHHLSDPSLTIANDLNTLEREVACASLGIFFDKLREKGLPPETLTAGLPYSLPYLQNPHERISWAAFRRFLGNAAQIWGDEGLLTIGQEFVFSPWARAVHIIANLLFSAADFYLWAVQPGKGPGAQNFTCIITRCYQLGPHHLKIESVMLPGYEPSQEFFLVAKGTFIAIPVALGLGPAQVNMQVLDDRAIYDVHVPAGGGALSGVRRWLARPFTARAAGQELKAAYELLYQRYRERELEVTERRRTEQNLHEIQLRYSAILDNTNDGIFLVDPNCNMIMVNQRAADILGYTVEEVIGRPLLDILVPAEHEESIRAMKAVLAGRILPRFERVVLRKDGSEGIMDANAILVYDNDNKPLYMQIIAHDVTQRKTAELALRESEARYRTLAENSNVGIWHITKDGYVSYANQTMCQMLEVDSQDQLIGKPPVDFVPPKHKKRLMTQFRKRQQGESSSYELDLMGLRGALRHALVSSAPLMDVNGQFQGVITTVIDITEKVQAQAALNQAQRLESLGLLAGGVAHDFNNLLVAMLSQTSLALAKLPEAHIAKTHIVKAVNAADRAADLTRQMLAYSGRGQFEVKPLDLNKLIQENLHLFRTAVSKNVQITSDLDDDLPLIEADSGQMQQVVMNLILNAAQATAAQSGVVNVSTNIERLSENQIAWQYGQKPLPAGNYVTLCVQDTGQGMDEETLAKIFDPFFTTKKTGRGLGLSAVLGIIRGHNGGLRVCSEPGKGTTFQLYFPAVSDSNYISEQVTTTMKTTPNNSTILIIDDEDPVREAVVDILSMAGMRVLTAVNGQEGIATYKQHMPNIQLVLLDLSMPGLSGAETFRELIKIDPQVKVVLSSGYSKDSLQDQFEGIVGFMPKPFDMDTLLTQVRESLS